MKNQWREEENSENRPMVDVDDILGVRVYNPPPKQIPPSVDEIKKKRIGLTTLFLGIGIGGYLLNHALILTNGWFIPELSMISGGMFTLGLYFLFFPGFFKKDAEGKMNASFILVIVFALLVGLANMLAIENGLFF
ncbi:MAG: hypothetical protein JXA25_16495 [Anaerolineales bacterium]|nr:hypothetical protein [Anaerolineales bacterium]